MRLASITALLVFTLLALAGCTDPEKAWELAEREDNNQAYLEFLARYPNGEFADRARQRMIELKEERAWERAQFRDRESNYQRFLDEYPDSRFAAAATARIYALKREAAWNTAMASDSIPELENFLAVYPDAPQAGQAAELIARLTPAEPEPPPVPRERAGEFRLQTGAFRTAVAAENEVRRLIGLFGERLYGPLRIVTPAETGNGWFLLHTTPLSRSEADDLCAYLQRSGQSCFLVNR